MKRADYYLAVSEQTKQDMINYFDVNPEYVHVVTHGVDPSFIHLRDRETLAARLQSQFRISRPYILFVGAIGHHKNVMGILKAYNRVHAGGQGTHDLFLVGPPDSASMDVRNFISKNSLDNFIHLTGGIPPRCQDMIDLYNGADCFVFPSFYEGWCSPPMEAMACGTPVIASNRSSIPETVGSAALLVNPDDVNDISEKIYSVLHDPELRNNLIQKGFARAKQLQWSDSARKMIEVYRKIEGEL
jgi:glycosyltransferase involved in cell wall biosynthesis